MISEDQSPASAEQREAAKLGGVINRHFSKEDVRMANKPLERCSSKLIIREMQIKTTMRDHLTLIRMGIIKKSTNNKWRRGCGEKGTLYTFGENVNWCSHYGDPQKTKKRASIWFNNPNSGHISGKISKIKRYMHLYVYRSPIYNRQDIGTT